MYAHLQNIGYKLNTFNPDILHNLHHSHTIICFLLPQTAVI